MNGEPRFRAALDELWEKKARFILDELWDLHCKKTQDYGDDEDRYANLRASKEYGVPAWQGALIRENDKTKRLQSYCKNGFLANEGVEDNLLDKAAYSLITLILFREEQG